MEWKTLVLEDGAYDVTATSGAKPVNKGDELEDEAKVVIAYKLDPTEPTTQTVEEFLSELFTREFIGKIIKPAVVSVMTEAAELAMKEKAAELKEAQDLVEQQLTEGIKITTI